MPTLPLLSINILVLGELDPLFVANFIAPFVTPPSLTAEIVAISVALRSADGFRIWSIGDTESVERELLERFFLGIEKFRPILVSWNGSGFDLPVIHYRSLLHSVEAIAYWEVGDNDRSFRYNNFVNRF